MRDLSTKCRACEFGCGDLFIAARILPQGRPEKTKNLNGGTYAAFINLSRQDIFGQLAYYICLSP